MLPEIRLPAPGAGVAADVVPAPGSRWTPVLLGTAAVAGGVSADPVAGDGGGGVAVDPEPSPVLPETRLRSAGGTPPTMLPGMLLRSSMPRALGRGGLAVGHDADEVAGELEAAAEGAGLNALVGGVDDGETRGW